MRNYLYGFLTAVVLVFTLTAVQHVYQRVAAIEREIGRIEQWISSVTQQGEAEQPHADHTLGKV